MPEQNFTASQMFRNANRFIEAYHAALQPVCRDTGLPPMAVDILMFFANNPESGTAKDVCQCRGFKSGIVSVHVDRLKPAIVSFYVERLVQEGYLLRQSVPGDRRKTRLVCTDAAAEIVERGRALQKAFAQKLVDGLSEADVAVFHSCLAAIGDNIEDIRKNGLFPENRR